VEAVGEGRHVEELKSMGKENDEHASDGNVGNSIAVGNEGQCGDGSALIKMSETDINL
jgi:hypothetical protein